MSLLNTTGMTASVAPAEAGRPVRPGLTLFALALGSFVIGTSDPRHAPNLTPGSVRH